MKIIAFIPARYSSSRFPGKPLADICGKPMIWWVYNQAKKVEIIDNIYVATDDDRIKIVCENYNIPVIMTSEHHPTGTDRIAEASERFIADLFVNIQGDEPMIDPDSILAAILPFTKENDFLVTNLMAKIINPVELINNTVPKVICNSENIGVFLSRNPIPYPKGSINYSFYKQVCVYGYKPDALRFYSKTKRGSVEMIEDIEILRFIENGIRVKFIEVNSNTIAVDTQNDLIKVRSLLNKDNNYV